MSEKRKQQIRTLLHGIQTGDPKSVEVIGPHKYIQHNPQTHEGREGLAALFARLAQTNPRVNLVRVFSDGDFVFAHTEYDFASRRIGFEVFRFEGDFAVEHWDNIQLRMEPTPSGHTMVDGPAEATDLEKTEETRALIRRFVEVVLIGRDLAALDELVAPDLIQHDAQTEDGAAALRAALSESGTGRRLSYVTLHRVLAEGNFALAAIEGDVDGVHSALYNLFRVADGRIAARLRNRRALPARHHRHASERSRFVTVPVIVEHWNTIEAIAPRSEWKNNNGKF